MEEVLIDLCLENPVWGNRLGNALSAVNSHSPDGNPIKENIGDFICTRYPKNNSGFTVMVCSVEECEDVKIKAGPATISLAKKINRDYWQEERGTNL